MRSIARQVVSVVLAVLAGGWIALGRLATPPLLGWAAVAALGLTVAWCIVHTRVNAPARGAADFIVFTGVVIGLVAAALVSGAAVLIGVAALGVMIACRRILERPGPPGNLIVAAFAGLPFMYGALAVGRPAAGIVPWILASWLYLIRGMVSELGAEPMNPAHGRRASRAALLSAALALAFVPASLVLPARAGFGMAYFLVAMFAQLAVLVIAARLIVGRRDGVIQLLKGAMLMGAIAMVAGRVT